MKTYLFDFDGTLVDSMPTYVFSMLQILDNHGIKYSDDIIKTITPLGRVKTAEYFVSLGVNKTVDEISYEMGEYMLREYSLNIPAKNNVEYVVKELKKRGASLNVLTASPHETLDPCLKRLGLYDLFDNVWSCDDFGTTKSDPNIYALAAAALGTEPENVLFLDDNLGADKTAKSAGMKVCGVYDKSSEEYTDEIKAVADFYIEDFSELLDIDF